MVDNTQELSIISRHNNLAGVDSKKPWKSEASQRTAVIVLGMHRSGTSAVTRVLNLLGCELPRTLRPANNFNEPGHWESSIICELNDEIFESAGTIWHDLQQLNPGWFHSPKAAEFREKALSVLAEEFGTSRLFVLKDPRMCRLLPFWAEVLRDAGVKPSILLPVRNPLEVAASLKKRNGFDPSYGHLLWLRYILDAEIASRGLPRFFTSYDRLMSDWNHMAINSQKSLGLAWPRYSSRVTTEIDSFLSSQYRHHNESPDRVLNNRTLPLWLRRCYEIINDWVLNGEKEQDYSNLDQIRVEFNTVSPEFFHAIESGRIGLKKVQKLTDSLAQVQSKLGDSEKSRLQNETVYQETLAQLEQDNQKIARLVNEANQLRTEADNARKALTASQQELSRLQDLHTHQVEELRQTAEIHRAEAERLGVALASNQHDMLAVEQFQTQVVEQLALVTESQQAESEKVLAALTLTQQEMSVRNQLQTEEINRLVQIAETERSESENARIALAATQQEMTVRDQLQAVEIARLTQAVDLIQAESEKLRLNMAMAQHELAVREQILSTEMERMTQQVDAHRHTAENANTLLAVVRNEYATSERFYLRDIARLNNEAEKTGSALRETNDQIRQLVNDRETARAEFDRLISKMEIRLKERTDEITILTRMLFEKDSESALFRENISALEKSLQQYANENLKLSQSLIEKDSESALFKENISALEKSLQQYTNENLKLSQSLIEKDSAVEKLIVQHTKFAKNARTEIAKQELLLKQHTDQIEILTGELVMANTRVTNTIEHANKQVLSIRHKAASELGRVITAILDTISTPFMPKNVRINRKIKLLNRAGIFNAEWYVSQYKDVADAEITPAKHYLLHGAAEGREPNSVIAEINNQ